MDKVMLVSLQDLARRLGVCDKTVMRLHNQGALPDPVFLPGSNRPKWKIGDIEAFISSLGKKKKHFRDPTK